MNWRKISRHSAGVPASQNTKARAGKFLAKGLRNAWQPAGTLVLMALFALASVTGCKYVKANARVAFLGDSLTEGWFYPRANFGVFGQTTAQIRVRSSAVLTGHRYDRLILLGGTNDVLTKVDPSLTIGNLEAMGELAQREGTEPVLCEIPPIFHSYNHSDTSDYSGTVKELNRRIVELAAAHHWRLVDFYDPLLSHPEYSSDGVHMKKLGYWTMEQALLKVVPDA
jgi:lysophospholipase L1-like esterase